MCNNDFTNNLPNQQAINLNALTGSVLISTYMQALSKVPTNVAHFAELGVYKQMRKKLPGTEKDMFPHLPRQSYPLVTQIEGFHTCNRLT